ncbi:hypothetical protein M0657_006460 [Pyricularia oryzae]|uniref:FHA domain-containing protein n=1 Tax=Pyricularia oryzae (strain P131) TaxID=1143193 RepID=L7JNE4_PYRO1|nr:hypothetical protein M0657_006460 [Pyricularia oryzae]
MASDEAAERQSHRRRRDDHDDHERDRHRSRRQKTRHDDSDREIDRRGGSRERKRHDHHRRSRSPEDRGHRRRSRDRDSRRTYDDKERRSRRRRDDSDDDDFSNGKRKDRKTRRRSRSRGDTARSSKRDSDRKKRDGSRSRRKEDDEHALQPVRRGGPLPSQSDSFAVAGTGEEAEPDKPKEKPNYGATGVLAAASNSVQQADGTTITLKYHEPPEARKPPARDDWRLFVFKGDDLVDTIPLASRSCWLVGRDAAVADLLAEHPSVSKQHAVIQFRHVEKRNEFGDRVGGVKPYLLDLESANGTHINGDQVPESRYLELRHKDVVKFGQSIREYVVMLSPKE